VTDASSRLAFLQKAMIPQVVVGVGDQCVENQPPPKGFHIALPRSAVLAQRVSNFQITSSFSVFRSKHAHRGDERHTPFAVAVEASQEEHRLASDVVDTGLRNKDARFLREGQCDRFLDHRVDFIVLAWEFRDGEMAALFPDVSLGPRAAK